MRWLIRILTKLIVGAACIGGMAIVLFDFFATQNLLQTLIKFLILSIIVGVVVRLANRIVDWSHRPPPPKPRRASPVAPEPVFSAPQPLPKVETVPRQPEKPPERRFAVPPAVIMPHVQLAASPASMPDKLQRFVAKGQQAIDEDEE